MSQRVGGQTAAVIVCPQDAEASGHLSLRLGGLSLLRRSLLAARFAGLDTLVVVGEPSQQKAMSGHWEGDPRLAGVMWRGFGEPLPSLPPRCVLLLPGTVIGPGDLRNWSERLPAPVSAPDALGLGPVALSSDHVPEAIAAARGGAQGLAAHLAGLAGAGMLEEIPWPGSIRQAVTSPGDVAPVERRLLRALRTPEDGPIVDRFVNRAFSGRLSRLLARTAVTPNQVTVASLLTGLGSAWLIGAETRLASVCGLFLFQLSVILDHADGEIARLKYQFSPFGKWLDNWSDHAVDLAVVAMLTWRVAEGGGRALVWLGLAAAVGVTGSFLLVFRWSLVPESAAARPPGLESLANRDGFCLALWASVLLDRPLWFLWALGVGANLFWVLWFVRAGLPPRSGR